MAKIFRFRKAGTKMPTVLDVAKYFLSLVDESGGSVMTHLKLQKLCYYAQAWHLVFEDELLFTQKFQAWAHGPACPQLWRSYKRYGYNPIPRPENFDVAVFNPKQLSTLEEVWEAYGDYDAKYLERLTHEEKPWIVARGGCQEGDSCDNYIELDLVKEYYSSLIQ